MKVKFLDGTKKAVAQELTAEILKLEANREVLAKYIRVYLSNKRQDNAKAKDRSEVSGGGRKPWKQKGTGRARHGSSRSPIWKGGGVTFGPQSDTTHKLKMNKKEKILAFVTALDMRSQEDTLYTATLPALSKAKEGAEYLTDIAAKGKVTVVTNDENIRRVFQNLEGVTVKNSKDLNAYDVAKAASIVFDSALLTEILQQKESVYFRK